MNLYALPLGLYALLHLALAVAAPSQVGGHLGPAALFVLAGVLVLAGILTQSNLLVGAGVVLSVLAPAWMGVLMAGAPEPLHLIVRGLIAAAVWWLWTLN